MKKKIMILGDSSAYPRSFPAEEKTDLEETYPYLLQNKFKDTTFWLNIMSNVTTEKICSIPISYIPHWKPDVIILHSGLNDSRPQGIPPILLNNLRKIFFPFLILERILPFTKGIYKKSLLLLENKYFVKIFAGYASSPNNFARVLKRLKRIFSSSKIYCLEIICHDNYEKQRPGVIKRKKIYNNILKDIFSDQFIELQNIVDDVDGFNVDCMHLNKRGHKAIFDQLSKQILD